MSPVECLGAGGCDIAHLRAHQLTLLPGIMRVSLHPRAAASPPSLLVRPMCGRSLGILEVFWFYGLALIAIFHQKKRDEEMSCKSCVC